MDDAVMGALSAWWEVDVARYGAEQALARLCVQLGLGSDCGTSTFLAATALDVAPASSEALALLERSLPFDRRHELWPRYETFVAAVPGGAASFRVRDRLIALLFELGHTYSALLQVDVTLDALMVPALTTEDVARLDRVHAGWADRDLASELDRLAGDVAELEAPALAEAAE